MKWQRAEFLLMPAVQSPLHFKHLNEELPDIRQYNPDITRGLEGIIRKATQKNSDERYDNIDILLSDIKLAIVEAVREKGGKGKAANNNVKAENKAADAGKKQQQQQQPQR